jgi:purine-binding chemotaxis protein CheW
MMSESRTYCTFLLDGQCHGVPVQCVQEVLRPDAMTRVPLAPSEVGGLINLRGQIVTVIDLRKRMNLPHSDPSSCGTHVIVERQGEIVSFLVDSLGDVREVESDQFELPPDTLHGPERELIVGTYKTEHDLLIVLDVEKLTEIDSRTTMK